MKPNSNLMQGSSYVSPEIVVKNFKGEDVITTSYVGTSDDKGIQWNGIWGEQW